MKKYMQILIYVSLRYIQRDRKSRMVVVIILWNGGKIIAN